MIYCNRLVKREKRRNFMRRLGSRSESFTDSVIRRMTRISDEYNAINLSQDFPDFDPPKEITDRLASVSSEGPHQYAITWGAKNFRDAVAKNDSTLNEALKRLASLKEKASNAKDVDWK